MAAVASVTVVAAPEATRHVGTISLARLPKIYPADQNRTEQDLETQDMQQPEIRNRAPHDQPSRITTTNRDTLTDTSETLTPSSSEDSIQSRVHRTDSPTKAKWQGLVERIPSLSLFSSGIDSEPPVHQEHNYDNFKQEKVENYPLGLPRLAALRNSDDDLSIYRSFNQCHARILTHMEGEITEVEKELHELDKLDGANPAMEYRLKKPKHKETWDPALNNLIEKLRLKLKEYDEILHIHSQIRSRGKPQERNHRSLFHWIINNKPLAKGYYDFIYHADDFVAVTADVEHGNAPNYFEERIRAYVRKHPKSFLKSLLTTEAEINKTTDPNVNYYSRMRLENIGKVITVFVAVSILLLPIFLLFLVRMHRIEMVLVVLVFVLVFAGIMSITTAARTQDLFLGTSAYAAVLVTFLGSLSGNEIVG